MTNEWPGTARALWALRDDVTLDAADWKIAVALIMFANDDGMAYPSLGRLASVARTSRGGVRRSLAKLELGLGPIRLRVERARRTNSGDSDTHRYFLTVVQVCDQADPGCDHPDPTPDHWSPTVGSPEPHGCDHPDPTGVITQTHKETSQKRLFEDTREETPEARVFSYWALNLWSKIHPTGEAKATADRVKHIRARLAEGFTVEQLCLVIDRVSASSFHLGENDRGTPYIEPKTIMPNRAKVEQWVATRVPVRAATRGPLAQHGTNSARDAEAAERNRRRLAELDSHGEAV